MGAQTNAQPIIIKRKKKVGGDGHHGGAWKVAYADFVTAMMAFFLLMWLLNATTEKQRKGIADYFAPTIPINRVSGGGDGSFAGDSIFTENTLSRNGSGASSRHPTEANQARGESGMSDTGDAETLIEDEVFTSLEAELIGKGGESTVMENALEHINTRVTDEGLVIEVFATESEQIFEAGTDKPTQLLQTIAEMIAEVSKTVTNAIAVGGHVPAQPIVVAHSSVWELSSQQATAMRRLLEDEGVGDRRVERVTGHADREPFVENPMAKRNNRLEIVFLRE